MLEDLAGRSLVAVLDAVAGYSGWDLAAFDRGRILLHCLIRSAVYDRANLGRLLRALQTGEVCVEALGPDGHWVRLPRAFWRADMALQPDIDHDDGILRARGDGGAEVKYRSPRLVAPQDKPAVETIAPMVVQTAEETVDAKAKRLSWQYARDILESDIPLPRYGDRISAAALARLVKLRLDAIGCRVEVKSIADYIRQELRDWEKQHPPR
jgi:hypothetical protein